MNILKQLLAWIFGFKFGQEKQEYEFIFGEAASKKVEHGVLIGTWARDGYGQRPITIGFHVVACTHPPALTVEFMQDLKEKAKKEGIVMERIYAYGGLMRARYDYAQPQPVLADPKEPAAQTA